MALAEVEFGGLKMALAEVKFDSATGEPGSISSYFLFSMLRDSNIVTVQIILNYTK